MEIKIGDRFRFGDDTFYHIWEITSNAKCIVIYSNDETPVGRIGYWRTPEEWRSTSYTYLGNYNKCSNFEELYNLLNS